MTINDSSNDNDKNKCSIFNYVKDVSDWNLTIKILIINKCVDDKMSQLKT